MTHRFKYLISVLVGILATVALAACGHSSDEPVNPDPTPEPTPEKGKRTVLVYMVAKNNLGGYFDNSDIDEMVEAAANGDLQDGRLLAYHSSDKGIVLKEITPHGVDTLKVYDNSELSVSVSRMRSVIADMKQLAPADDYGLVLWSHASGWLQNGIEETIPAQARSYGLEGSNKRMNITSLAYALHDAGFSHIYFDCCFMGSIETLYELRDCADVFVASAAEIHAEGMPYNKNLKHFFNPALDTEQSMLNAAMTSFDTYNSIFQKGDCPCTFAVVRANKLEALAKATKDIYLTANKRYEPGYSYQKFRTGTCQYFDLRDYVSSVCSNPQLLAAWDLALSEAIPFANASPWVWSSFEITRFCGLSTYILYSTDNITDNKYNTLSWYDDVASYLPN